MTTTRLILQLLINFSLLLPYFVFCSSPSPLVCSLSSLSSVVSSQDSLVTSFLSTPASVLSGLVDRLRDMRGVALERSSAWGVGFVTDFNQLAANAADAAKPPGLYDASTVRTSDFFQFPSASVVEYNTTCAAYYNGDLSRDPGGCLFPASDRLTTLCAQRYPTICPDPMAALSGAINASAFYANNPGTMCPYYCLNPAQFNNSRTEYGFYQSLFFASWLPKIHADYKGTSYAWYYCDVRGNTRYLPVNSDCNFAECVGFADLYPLLAAFFINGPGFVAPPPSPQIAQYALPYYDSISTNTLLSVTVAIYDGADFQGSVSTDLLMGTTQRFLDTVPKTANSFIVLAAVSAAGGPILAATQLAYDRVFCPQYCDPAINGGHYDVNNRLVSTTPLTLSDSTYGFKAALDVFSSVFATQPSMAAAFAAPPFLTTMSLGASPQSYYVSYSFVSLSPNALVYAYFSPVTEIDAAAVWASSANFFTVRQPKLSVLEASQLAALAANPSDALLASWNPVATQTFTVTASGILDVTYSIKVSVPWVRLFAVNPLSGALSGPLNFTTQSFQLLGSSSLAPAAPPASHTYFFEIDWARATRTNKAAFSIEAVPDPNLDRSGCFPRIIIQTELQYNAPLSATYSPSLIVLSFVVCVFGCWISLILFEQLLFDYERFKSALPRHAKRAHRVALVANASASGAMAFCGLFASLAIGQSQLGLTDDSFTLAFSPGLAITSVLPMFVCVYCAFYLLARQHAHLVYRQPIFGRSGRPLNEPNERSQLSGASNSYKLSQSQPSSDADTANNAQPSGAQMMKAFISHFRIGRHLLELVCCWLAFFLALLLGNLMFISSLSSTASISYTPSYIIIGCFVSALLVCVALFFYGFVVHSRVRPVGAFVMAGGVLTMNELAFLCVSFDFPSTSAQLSAQLGGYWSAATVAIIGVVIASITCFLLMGLQFQRLKLSRAKMDHTIGQLTGALKRERATAMRYKAQLRHVEGQMFLIHQLRSSYRPMEAVALLSGQILEAVEAQRPERLPTAASVDQELVRQVEGLKKTLIVAHQGQTSGKETYVDRFLARQATAGAPLRPPFFRSAIKRQTIPLSVLFSHPVTLELFKDACQSSLVAENVAFWLAVENFKFAVNPASGRDADTQAEAREGQAAQSPHALSQMQSLYHPATAVASVSVMRDLLAYSICDNFIVADAPHQINLSASERTAILQAVDKGRIDLTLFASAQREVENLITTGVYLQFVDSPAYLLCLALLAIDGGQWLNTIEQGDNELSRGSARVDSANTANKPRPLTPAVTSQVADGFLNLPNQPEGRSSSASDDDGRDGKRVGTPTF